jgi:hypothetical protein
VGVVGVVVGGVVVPPEVSGVTGVVPLPDEGVLGLDEFPPPPPPLQAVIEHAMSIRAANLSARVIWVFGIREYVVALALVLAARVSAVEPFYM